MKKLEPTWMVRRLSFRKIDPFWQKVDFNQKKKRFRKLSHLSNMPVAKFYLKREKWQEKKLKAYIGVDFDI